MNKAFTTSAALGLVAAGGLAATTLLGANLGSGGTHAAPAPARGGQDAALRTYAIDNAHSNVVFKIRHAGVTNFYGRFNEIEGAIQFDEGTDRLEAVRASIKAESVDTGNDRRDGHLRGPDFFNARQYPEISFQSTSIEDGKITGRLKLHGVEKTISASLSPVWTGSFRGNDAIGFEANIEITRTDFGMRKYVAEDGSDNGPLGNTVKITVAIEAYGQ